MKKILICYFASIATITGFFTALFFNAVPLVVIFIIAFTACLLWFADIMRVMNKQEQRRRRRAMKAAEPEYRRIDFADDLGEDEPEEKPAAVGIVRPGSCPSITYANMRAIEKGREINENIRAEA